MQGGGRGRGRGVEGRERVWPQHGVRQLYAYSMLDDSLSTIQIQLYCTTREFNRSRRKKAGSEAMGVLRKQIGRDGSGKIWLQEKGKT